MIFCFNATEIFDVAIKIEENGKRFYDRCLQIIQDPDVKKLFEELGQEEIKHKERFQTLKSQLPSGPSACTVFDPNHELNLYINMMADQHVFTAEGSVEAKLAGIKDARDALKLAAEFEKDSVIFFLSMQDATEGAKDKEFIGSLVKEEQEHLRRISLEMKRLGRK